MTHASRPLFVVYVAWHPAFAGGASMAKLLYEHYRRKLYENVAGGAGVSVLYRFAPPEGADSPAPIDFGDSESSAVVVLLDEHFAADAAYMAWLRSVCKDAEDAGLRCLVTPVALDAAMTRTGLVEQAIRWDQWATLDPQARMLKLLSSLTYQFCRMLRALLGKLKNPARHEDELAQFLNKVQVFLSHSKRDADGQRIAKLIRQQLFDGEGLASFFDVHDIPPGLPFDKVLLHQVKVSAVVVVHTDSFSSREWCRREVIEAKRWNVPLVVANCISDLDERGFPYMGNVPFVRMDPAKVDRIEYVVARLLDEVMKDFLWQCRVELVKRGDAAEVIFLPRPPELISLAAVEPAKPMTFVYPDPPLGAEEQRLFEVIAPTLRLKSMTEWLASADKEAS
jgi:TIR domain